MARTPLFDVVRRSLLAARRERCHPEIEAGIFDSRLPRRQILKAGALLAGATAASPLLSCASRSGRAANPETAPKVAIIGAGLGGLNCGWTLRKGGVPFTIYEATNRLGGRVFTREDLIGQGLYTELGGEFIDSTHEDMIALAEELNLELMDMHDPGDAGLVEDAYFFEGRHYSERQVVEAFAPLAARIERDVAPLGDVVDYREHGGAEELDRLSLAEYLDRIGASGWIRSLLEVAFIAEYGLEPGDQSCLNLLFLIDPDVSTGDFRAYGDSDERFKVRGGNQLIATRLAEQFPNSIINDRRLMAIRAANNGYNLHFMSSAGEPSDAFANIVIMAIPFTVLREVELDVELPEVKRSAIMELGYGTNSKLLLGFDRRVWREHGYAGNTYSDEFFQVLWDNSRRQEQPHGGMTVYLGGTRGLLAEVAPPGVAAMEHLAGAERVYPGLRDAWNKRAFRFHWPAFPLTLGSYSCYKPGQWTTIAGAESEPVGNLYFCGEHCSYDFQGYMNGAAESGRVAAESVMKRLGVKMRRRRAAA